ncbi:uncharacterized protein LOC120169652 isoform X1 [Hibiscus syriacus]|uniref:uncharacterized protein LOC120169652 isoform X1 n=1 Tax=Hibiscus syriacus TaxID=106335 RepID=UPI001921DA38|nr:uncharacterized protein LOC120169652 isoform X1 [Hibiscus syriacus]
MVGGRTGAPATHRAHGTSCGDHSFASLLHLPVRNCVSSKHDHHQQARYSVEPSGENCSLNLMISPVFLSKKPFFKCAWFQVYGLSWLVIVAVLVILKIMSMSRMKFSADFQLMFRLLKLLMFIGAY